MTAMRSWRTLRCASSKATRAIRGFKLAPLLGERVAGGAFVLEAGPDIVLARQVPGPALPTDRLEIEVGDLVDDRD